jgi:hypothetical protein
MIRRIRTTWNRIFFEQQSTEVLGVFRAIIGLLVLFKCSLLLPDLEAWYGKTSILPYDVPYRFEFAVTPAWISWLRQWSFGVPVVFALTIGSALCLTLGLFSRFSSLLVYLGYCLILPQDLAIFNGGDAILKTMCFFLIFTPSGGSYSLDKALRERRGHAKSAVTYSPWPMRIIQFQISVVYVATVYFKCQSEEWLKDGTAVYFIINMFNIQRHPLPDLVRTSLAFSNFLTWGTLVIELLLGVGLWSRRTRYPILLAGIALHLSLEVLLLIPIFQWVMIAGLISFIDPKDWKALLSRIGARKAEHGFSKDQAT